MEISLNAYGKINLGLDVVRKREDGYHEVKMIMQTVQLYDRLTFVTQRRIYCYRIQFGCFASHGR